MKNQLLKSIIRSCTKFKRSVIINLVGLSIGFAVLLAIIFFIREELNYNKFHKNLDNIYCIFTQDDKTTNGIGWNQSVPALPAAMRAENPEVKEAALVYNGQESWLVTHNNKKYFENIQLAEPNLFNIFSFPLIYGDINKDISNKKILAISRKMSEKYFGKQNPVGKTLQVNNNEIFSIVAVFENIPNNSSLRFDFWAPIGLLEEYHNKDHLQTWYNLSFQAYVLLHDKVSVSDINKKLYNRIQQNNPESQERAQLYPFSNLYLKAWGHKKDIRMMILIASFILVIVSLNFINLQSAESFKRIKDFGIRKLNGANNSYINTLLIGEALFIVIIATIIAMFLTYFSSDSMLQLLGKPSAARQIISIQSIAIVSGVAILIAIISGLIPGLIIKSIPSKNAIRKQINEKIGVKRMRYIFTCFQFGMAIGLIICLLVTNKQLNYLQNKNLGFNKEQLLYINLRGELHDNYKLLKEELNRNANILSSSLTSRSPIGIYWNGGGWNWDGKSSDLNPVISFIETDEDFPETFGMKLNDGTYFKSEIPGVVINKTFADIVSPNESALNKVLYYEEENVSVSISGILDDFHFKPLNQKIGALMLIPQMGFDDMKYLFVKISPTEMKSTLKFIEETMVKLNPLFPSEYHFIDADFERLYKNEERLRNQMMFFSLMAILISCIGLWGILIFVVQQRTKEIGIRKVNGAKISEILTLLNKDFIKWVAIAFIIACPIAYYAMNKWLENFAYKTTLSWWIFALAGMLALGIVLLTVSWQSWRAATRNPVEALRYE